VRQQGRTAHCGQLNEDMISWKSPPQLLPGYDKDGGRWHYFEAPWLMRHGAKYILSYMMSYGDCPGNNGTRIARPNCSWSHGGFDYISANSCWVKGAGLDLGGPQGGQDIAKYRPNRGANRISEGPRGAKPTGQGGRAAPLAPLS
jgi:hypothetical protein